jgi:NADP-dependent 3-hydroxy acid dehydrogenase YdfG
MTEGIKDKVVVITETSSGLGEATARRLADLGVKLVPGICKAERELDGIPPNRSEREIRARRAFEIKRFSKQKAANIPKLMQGLGNICEKNNVFQFVGL